MATSPDPQVGQPGKKAFPLMQFPPELRRMVYREALAPDSALDSFTGPFTDREPIIYGSKYHRLLNSGLFGSQKLPNSDSLHRELLENVHFDDRTEVTLYDKWAGSVLPDWKPPTYDPVHTYPIYPEYVQARSKGSVREKLTAGKNARAQGDSGMTVHSLLLVDQQISAEALETLYDDCFFKIKIHWAYFDFYGLTIARPADYIPSPGLLPKLRNITIAFNELMMLLGAEGYNQPYYAAQRAYFPALREPLELLCDEIGAQCHRLKNVVIEVPCWCSTLDRNGIVRPSREQMEREKCIMPADFEKLLSPLRRLRVTGKVTLDCRCSAVDELEPLFNRLAAIVQSADPIEERLDTEKIWFDLKERAKPILKDNVRLQENLGFIYYLKEEIRLRENLEVAGLYEQDMDLFTQVARSVEQIIRRPSIPDWELQ